MRYITGFIRLEGETMAAVEARLQELGIDLPNVPASLANYVGAVRTGNLIYLSGRLPMQ